LLKVHYKYKKNVFTDKYKYKKNVFTDKYSNKEVIMSIKLRPGETAPKSGTYKVVNKQGKTEYTVKMEKGETMPPTQSSGKHFEID